MVAALGRIIFGAIRFAVAMGDCDHAATLDAIQGEDLRSQQRLPRGSAHDRELVRPGNDQWRRMPDTSLQHSSSACGGQVIAIEQITLSTVDRWYPDRPAAAALTVIHC